jgi:hypothetical protein
MIESQADLVAEIRRLTALHSALVEVCEDLLEHIYVRDGRVRTLSNRATIRHLERCRFVFKQARREGPLPMRFDESSLGKGPGAIP